MAIDRKPIDWERHWLALGTILSFWFIFAVLLYELLHPTPKTVADCSHSTGSLVLHLATDTASTVFEGSEKFIAVERVEPYCNLHGYEYRLKR